ncbi:hypothetical protein H312_01476 [Anncaliia algerae PRA339]|uniref:Uncharacterized protein n=1 Tax=Anncaliia algerae PRA339 TaxID=1288291 RepID=A0A059F1S4_9MICR|nr:hypothetical protein H312_01476 [Anncaliia algerae PRA339]
MFFLLLLYQKSSHQSQMRFLYPLYDINGYFYGYGEYNYGHQSVYLQQPTTLLPIDPFQQNSYSQSISYFNQNSGAQYILPSLINPLNLTGNVYISNQENSYSFNPSKYTVIQNICPNQQIEYAHSSQYHVPENINEGEINQDVISDEHTKNSLQNPTDPKIHPTKVSSLDVRINEDSLIFSNKLLKLGFPKELLLAEAFTGKLYFEYHANKQSTIAFYTKERLHNPECCGKDIIDSLCQHLVITRDFLKNIAENISAEIDINEFKSRLFGLLDLALREKFPNWHSIKIDHIIDWVFKKLEYRLLNISFFFANFIYLLYNSRIKKGISSKGFISYNLFERIEKTYKFDLVRSIRKTCNSWKENTVSCMTIRDYYNITFEVVVRNIFIVGIDCNNSTKFLYGFKNKTSEIIRELIK